MPRIKKSGPWNPQKATAYVGKGVLKYGDTIPAIRGSITPVPNGPLIKKKGEFKGSTLKNGGNMAKIKKAQYGTVNPGKPTKKIKLKEDSRDYITKIKTDDEGNIVSLKSRRTLKGLLSGAPRAKKIMKNGGKTPAWQRKEGKNPEGGLNAKGVASYRKANPGSKLKTAVTTKPSKLKAGSKAASRRKSFCSRMSGMKKKLTSAKTANDPNSRINKSLRKWNC
jgi:hypothetical protein